MNRTHARIFIKIFLLLVLVFSLFATTGCNKKKSPSSASNNENVVVFTDALGREVQVPKSPERVAALIGSFADIWTLAGGKVCASADDAWDDFGLDMEDAINLGGTKDPSLEQLFASDPDFIIASASTSKNVEWLQTLEDAGFLVAYFEVANFDDYLSMLDICTDITGRKDLYKQYGLDIKQQVESAKGAFLSRDLSKEKKTVLLLRASSGYIRAKNSESSILGQMLAELDCTNIADSDETLLENLSIESIIQQDPYRIFIVPVGDDKQTAIDNVTNLMEENPAWQQLTAVKEGRLHFMDNRLFNLKPNAKWALSYETLISILQEP